jgi:uncharacterized protein DUF4402
MRPRICSARCNDGRLLILSALALALFDVAPVEARDADTARASAQISSPINIVNSADMDFGKIAYSASAGTVVLTAAATPSCFTTGSLVQTGNCKAAKFEGIVHFLFGLQVTEPIGNSILLTGPAGATMRLDNFTYGAGSGTLDLGQSGAIHRFWILNVTGSYSFFMGGTLHVGANQAPGIYNGEFQIQLNYN